MTEIKFKDKETWAVAYYWCLYNISNDQWCDGSYYTHSLLFRDPNDAVLVELKFA
jgi:hypothetical protein